MMPSLGKYGKVAAMLEDKVLVFMFNVGEHALQVVCCDCFTASDATCSHSTGLAGAHACMHTSSLTGQPMSTCRNGLARKTST